MTPAWLIKQLQKTVRALTVCAMVPAAVLSGLPAFGCICADGHYELFCQAGHCSNEEEHQGSGCTCCTSVEAQANEHKCCQRKTACCRGTESKCKDQLSSSSLRVGDKGGCTPAIREAAATTLTAVVPALDDHHLPVAWTARSVQVWAPVKLSYAAHLQLDTGPPPDDLIVTLARLVI